MAGHRQAGWVWAATAILIALHHDFWWWDDRALVLGMVPVGLAYHAGFSLAAAALWAAACRWAWPEHIEEWAEGDPENRANPERPRP